MKSLTNRVTTSFLIGLSIFPAETSSAFTPGWIECNGMVVTKGALDGKPVSKPQPARDIYAFDDASENFYKYSESRQTTDPEPVMAYTAKEIRWGAHPELGQTTGADWEGKLDRQSLSLTMNYHERGTPTSMVWSQQCTPTGPLPSGASADAAHSGNKG